MNDMKDLFAQLPSGVTVITTDQPFGFTASSFSFISLQPAIAAVSVMKDSRAAFALRSASRFHVSFLAADQADVAKAFAFLDDRLNHSSVYWMKDGTPYIKDAAAEAEVHVTEYKEVGDHWMVFGNVNLVYRSPRPVLGYCQRTFFCHTKGPLT